MNLRTIRKTRFLVFFLLSSLLFSSCSVKMNSVTSRNYSTEDKNILILISYDRYTEKIVKTFEEEFMRQAMNSKNKIDFFVIEPIRVSGALELNEQSDTAEKIKAKIAELNADIAISIVTEYRGFVNGGLTYVRYLATGRETVENTEIWKSRIELNMGNWGGRASVAKKMATEFYNRLVSDRVIQQK